MIYFGDDKMPDLCNRHHPFHYTTALNLLSRMGINIDEINILAVGEYENYKGEVRSQKPEPNTTLTKNTEIRLEIGYPSAIDFMPFQFFYGLRGKSVQGDWESSARHFMAPFDAAVIRHEAATRYEALKYSFGVVEDEYLQRYLKLFDFDAAKEAGDTGNHALWATLLPVFNESSGNCAYVEKILHSIFKHKFRIIENIEAEYDIPEDMHYRLGSKTGRLGRECLLGKTFTERDSCYAVKMSGLTREEVSDFLPGKPKRKKLETILELFMPSNLEYKLSFRVVDKKTLIGSKGNNALLGYSTHA